MVYSGDQSRYKRTHELLEAMSRLPRDVKLYLTGAPYPHLQKYMRYRIQSHLSNDGFLEACSKMPVEYFKLATTERRSVTLLKPEQEIAAPLVREEVLAGSEYRRISVLEAVTGRK